MTPVSLTLVPPALSLLLPPVHQVGDKVAWSDLELEGGEELDPPGPLLLAINKPTGYVVTAPDDEKVSDPVVYDLLPYRWVWYRWGWVVNTSPY